MLMTFSSSMCINDVLKQTRNKSHDEDKESENNIIKTIILFKQRCESLKKNQQWFSVNVESASDFIAIQSLLFQMSKSDIVMRYL